MKGTSHDNEIHFFWRNLTTFCLFRTTQLYLVDVVLGVFPNKRCITCGNKVFIIPFYGAIAVVLLLPYVAGMGMFRMVFCVCFLYAV